MIHSADIVFTDRGGDPAKKDGKQCGDADGKMGGRKKFEPESYCDDEADEQQASRDGGIYFEGGERDRPR